MQLWLGRVGIELPFKLAGEVDLAAKIGVPITALNDGRAYRFHGTAKSSRVVIDDLELLDISAEADYADGVLALEELRLHLPLAHQHVQVQPGDRLCRTGERCLRRIRTVPSGLRAQDD